MFYTHYYKQSCRWNTGDDDMCKTYCTRTLYTTIFLKMNPRGFKRVEDTRKLKTEILI